MQLFARTFSLSGPLADVYGYATDMRSFVSDKAGRELALWSVTFGAPLGTFVFSTLVEGLADVSGIGRALASDPEYHAKLAVGRSLSTAPPVDSLSTIMHGTPDSAPPVGSVAVITRAQISNGAYIDAVIWGVEMAQHVEQVTGVATMFTLSEFGPIGEVTWIGTAPDAATADATNKALATDADYIARLNSVGTLFIPGSGHRSCATRIA